MHATPSPPPCCIQVGSDIPQATEFLKPHNNQFSMQNYIDTIIISIILIYLSTFAC